MTKRKNILLGLASSFVAFHLMASGGAVAQSFYENSRPLEIIIPFSPGAGSDVSSRLLAPFLTAHIEGNPSVTALNVPGGAGVIGLNRYGLSPHDGHTLLVTASSVWIQWLLGNDQLQFDLSDTVPIIGFPGNTILAISPSTGFTEVADLLDPAEPLAMGASDLTGGHLRLILALELLGVADNVRMVFGYDGAGRTRIAFEQGEINMVSHATSAYLQGLVPLVEAGDAIPLFQIGILDENGDMVRDPVFPDIKTVRELYVELHGEEPSGALYDAVKLFGGLINDMQTAFLVHADAPPEAIEALHAGVASMVDDPTFFEIVGSAVGSDRAIIGAEAERFRQRLLEIDPETLVFVRRLLTDKYGVPDLGV